VAGVGLVHRVPPDGFHDGVGLERAGEDPQLRPDVQPVGEPPVDEGDAVGTGDEVGDRGEAVDDDASTRLDALDA
jgi:hypothetical protein